MDLHGVSRRLVELIWEEPLEELVVLDVGCGSGRLSFIVAERAKEVIGIDLSPQAVEEARRAAKENTRFFVMDAELQDYTVLGRIDMVVSNLCMSDRIVENTYRALPQDGAFAFACFHADHLLESGRRSRFSYSVEEMQALLVKTGFDVERLVVERRKVSFKTSGEALRLLGPRRVRRWSEDGRLEHLMGYVQSGGRELTLSTLVGKARKR